MQGQPPNKALRLDRHMEGQGNNTAFAVPPNCILNIYLLLGVVVHQRYGRRHGNIWNAFPPGNNPVLGGVRLGSIFRIDIYLRIDYYACHYR